MNRTNARDLEMREKISKILKFPSARKGKGANWTLDGSIGRD
jgi:hypothetical protein